MNYRTTLISLLSLGADAPDSAIVAAAQRFIHGIRARTDVFKGIADTASALQQSLAAGGIVSHGAPQGGTGEEAEEQRLCAQFLSDLSGLGAREIPLRTVLEAACRDLLRTPSQSRWTEVSPFLGNGMPNPEVLSQMQADLLAGVEEQANHDLYGECLVEIGYWAAGLVWKGRIEESLRTKAREMSAASLFCVAAVMALAHRAGVDEARRPELAALVIKAASRPLPGGVQ